MGFMDKLSPVYERCGCTKKKQTPDPEKKQAEEQTPGENTRAQWSSPTEFLLTCIGYSVGLGNVWRFPYLCYKSGGGAFIIPYIIMMFLIGMPLLFMEYAFGQYFGVGGLTIFKRVCPMFQGIGWGYVILNGLVCIYYNVIIGLSLYYLFASFTMTLPWGNCNNEWNTVNCGDPIRAGNTTNATLTTISNVTAALSGNVSYAYNTVTSADSLANATNSSAGRMSPSEEYWRYKLLAVTPEHDINNLGHIRWHLCLCLLLAWVLVVLFVCKGIKSTGKVVYFTATFPYLMLTVLVVRGVTLPGASEGILYFVTPNWSRLKDPEVWFSAATQLFYSTNLAWGGMITMASYNNFNHNCFRDALVINFISFFTSIYAGFAVFSVIGYMASESGQAVDTVIKSGPGLAFIVYPRALGLMPLAPMWSALFFFMLFLLGIGSQMVLIETVVTGLVDEFKVLGRNHCIRLMTTIAVSVLLFMFGLPCTTQMVQIETVVTGLVDEFKILGKNARYRFTTAIGICAVGFLLGLPCTTQMVDFETVMSGLCDEFPQLRKRRLLTAAIVACCFFLLGLPQVTQGGMYVLQLMDWYSAGFCVLVIAMVECIVINWIYGNSRFSANIKEMLGSLPQKWWRICWMFVSPILIGVVLVFTFVRYERAKYGAYTYPVWADTVGWMLTFASILPIFVVGIYKLIKAPGFNIKEKWKNATRSNLPGEHSKISTIEIDHDRKVRPDEEENQHVELDEYKAQEKALMVDKDAV